LNWGKEKREEKEGKGGDAMKKPKRSLVRGLERTQPKTAC